MKIIRVIPPVLRPDITANDDVMNNSSGVSDTATSNKGARDKTPNPMQDLGVKVQVAIMEPTTDNLCIKGLQTSLEESPSKKSGYS